MVKILNGEIVADNDPRLASSAPPPASARGHAPSRNASFQSPVSSSSHQQHQQQHQQQGHGPAGNPRGGLIGTALAPGSTLGSVNDALKRNGLPSFSVGGGIVVEPIMLVALVLAFLFDVKIALALALFIVIALTST